MAQVTITHLQETAPEFRKAFHDSTRRNVGLHLFGLDADQITPDDLTVRTLAVYTDASSSGADAEVHIEIAQDDQPKDENGDLLGPEASQNRLDNVALYIGRQICFDTGKTVNVWATCYAKTGWANYGLNTMGAEAIAASLQK